LAPPSSTLPLVAGGDVTNLAISPQGRWVVCRADQNADGGFELFSVLLAGTPEEAIGDLRRDVQVLIDAAEAIRVELGC